MTSLPALLTTSEVAEMFAVEPSTVRRWIVAKKLTAIRTPSGQNRIPRAAVEALLGATGEGQPQVRVIVHGSATDDPEVVAKITGALAKAIEQQSEQSA